MRHVGRGLVLLCCCATFGAADQKVFAGAASRKRSASCSARGLPVVFSSEIVKPGMRVLVEPHSSDATAATRRIAGPARSQGGNRTAPRAPRRRDRNAAAREPGQRATSATRQGLRNDGHRHPRAETSQYSDRVTVWGWSEHPPAIAGSETRLTGRAVQTTSSVLSGDGLEPVQSMPRVGPADDFRSEFSVRASPYRQIGVVIDGVATPWLQHTVYGRRDAGSLSMFASDIVGGIDAAGRRVSAAIRRRARRRAPGDSQRRFARLHELHGASGRHERSVYWRGSARHRRPRILARWCAQQLPCLAAATVVAERCRVRVRRPARETRVRRVADATDQRDGTRRPIDAGGGGRAARRAAWQRNRSRGLADRWMAVDARIAYRSPSTSGSHRAGTRDHLADRSARWSCQQPRSHLSG